MLIAEIEKTKWTAFVHIKVKASHDAQVLCLTAIGNLKLTEKKLKETKVSGSLHYNVTLHCPANISVASLT